MERGQPHVSAAASEDALVPPYSSQREKGFVAYVQRIGSEQGWPLFLHAAALVFIAWIPSMMVAYALHLIFPMRKNPAVSLDSIRTSVGMVIVAPLAETMSMRYFFMLLRIFSQRLLTICWLSAACWGAMHWIYAGWGIHAIWPFFVLSLCYLRLEEISLWRAMWMTSLIHAACNGLSLLSQVAIDHVFRE
jgi:hypothetical protein